MEEVAAKPLDSQPPDRRPLGSEPPRIETRHKPWLERIARRYEPVAAAVGAAFLIIQLVPALHTNVQTGPRITGFQPTRPPAGAISGPTTTAAVGPAPGTGGGRPSGSVNVPSPNGTGAGNDATTGGGATVPPPVLIFARPPAPGGAGGVAVAADGTVFATLGTSTGSLAHFTRGGTLDQVRDLGATSSGPTAVVAGPPGTAYVLTSSPAAVVLVDLGTGEVRPYSTIPNVAPCVPVVRPTDCDASPIDRPPMPWALAFDTQGNGFVADAGQGAIWRIPRGGGAPTEWLVDTTFARTDRPSGPTGLAFDGAGNLVMAVPATLTDDAGVIYVQSRTADGSAGARRTLATMKAGEHPASIAISQPGHLYVALPDSSTVVVLDSDGTELRRIAIDAAYNAGTITGVAFQATSLLVAGRASTPEGQTGIVSLQVGEPGGELSTP